MPKKTRESFVKRQKEIKRKQKAQEKQAKRQGKKDRPKDDTELVDSEQEQDPLC